ncbi:hypothetical protein PC129_g9361 [Phytophthora cactorum]|uniref:Armadillo-type fold n=1 Tax=Phytophthora cactorum TaxID=29920 RepID=A0A329SJ73_9STRA|nr:hypothetical protein Pcac1_g18672 [Phytophthora cactorum]KAG2837358.1 hypothetical protein PC112_g4940 [Phytophthora cactorum]KAG2839027.1 hypothetical protein PC111_g4012 [Phytophthora cactorum]KAG2856304.1 hypothetical protein PC113_g11679 [Phytophthora cactorum]KAG2903844.1 hypothetical protein PC114_g12094 [Phytophthora cactorum]
MDLSALWNREKTRLAAELHLIGVGPSNGGTRASFIAAKSDCDIVPTASRNRTKTSIVTPSLTVKPPKKKSSTSSAANSMRDQVFQLMVDTSIAPLSTETTSQCFGSNEFAMEYADRAVRRFVPQPAQPQLSLTSPAPTSSNVGFSSSFRGPTVRNQSTRASTLSLHAPSPSPVLVSQSSVSTFPKSAQILIRKNGRKRAGTEYSSQALKPYGGDIFGTRGAYIDGMLYMSRMKRSYQAMLSSGKKFNFASPPWGELAKVEGRSVLKDGVSDAFAVAGGGKLSVSTASRRAGSVLVLSYPHEDDGEPGSTLTSVQRKQQQRCSLTLSNWSFNPENARLMVQENVVEALIRLCKDGDKTTRLHCVTAFMNLSHLCELRRVIVQQGAVKTVAEIVNDMEDKTIRTACAITLCNLCSLQGEEGLLVEDGAVSALSTLINEHEKVSHICRCALFNLTCVSQSYHKIESVLKAFIALTSTRNSSGNAGRTEEEYDDITAKALCNLSNLKRIRLRLMEEGIISAITSLLHPNIPLIQELLAHILLNLSRLATCRNEMVAKGSMGTLVALAGASSAITTKCLIGITLWNLSKDPGNAVRMVQEGLLLLVNELCRGDLSQNSIPEEESASMTTKEEDILQVCARTLYNVSCCEDSRSKLVERDAVNTLSSISQRSSEDDAKQMCTLALCNLLSVQKAAADIVTAGAITALIQLSMAPGQSYETRNLFSKALHGLCDKAATRAAVTDAGVIPALLFLSSIDNEVVTEEFAAVLSEIRARCTAAFACLAADTHTAVHVCNAAVVQCVTRILVLAHSNVAIERFCCSCLSLLCRDEQCSLIMVEVGAIEMVLATCVESHDQESKASCCHVLASVSRHPSCCRALVRMGVISVLATLAKIKEDATIQRCCAITLANLSVEPEIRETLASAGIVAIVSVLSNSYSEDSQCDCAKVLCNLSCIRGNEAALVGEGAVSVLMMMSMVRAVNVSTKETCIRALLNLVNAETMKHMVKEGLVKVLSAYAGLGSKQVATFVTIIFGKLLNHPVGRNALCAERSSLHALFQLMTYDSEAAPKLIDEERQLASLHEKLLSELVYYENSRLLSVQAGILDALQRISMYEEQYSHDPSHCAEKTLALVFFTLAKSEDSRMAVASSSNLGTVLKFLNLHAAKSDCDASECAVYAAATLCWLGWHEDTRQFLQISDIPCALTQMLQIHANGGDEKLVSYSSEAIKTCVLTLCCLAHSSELLEVMLTGNVVAYLNGILIGNNDLPSQLSTDPEFVALACILFRQLSHVSGFASAIVDQPAPILELFHNLVQQVVVKQDVNSALDCADALCSIVFTPALEQQVTDKRRESLLTPKPSQFLVERRVLSAIGLLLSEEQLPETRWRCSASLWALSSVPEYRKELVELGVTPMLVSELYRAAKIASLNTLQCCAGALCSLTIVPEENNSAKMVEEGAMPALIQLAKLENETIREHCTLALSNLSGPSPKVESGAVSALLNMSLDVGSVTASAAPRRASCQPQPAVLSRPPLVRGERHKQFAVLPSYTIEISQNNSLDGQKFEAELAASTPPPPHLLTIAADLVGPSTRLAKNETTTQCDEGTYEFVETKFFSKLDPEESLALMTGTEEREDEEDTWVDTRSTGYAGNQEQDRVVGPIKGSQNQCDKTRSSEQSHGNSGHRFGASIAPSYTLSPLSRVVIRKAHAVQVARKLKDATTRKRRDGDSQTRAMLGSQSSPCFAKSALDSELQKNEKKTTQAALASRPPSQLASLSVSTSTLSANVHSQAALLAAVSAAGLYGAAPRRGGAKSNSASLNAKQQKKRTDKTRRKEPDSSSDPNSELLTAQPKTLTPATSIEEFQGQAKLLGLWS